MLAGLVARHPSAVAELYDRYADLVRGILARTLNSGSDTDDLAQETFLIVVRKCDKIADPSLLRSFLVSVATRVARNELRRRKVRRIMGRIDDVPEPALVVPPHDPAVAESIRELYAALDGLTANTRVAFVLRYVEQYSLVDTAKACGCSLATVKRWLARAEKCLSAALPHQALLAAVLRAGSGDETP